MIPRFLEQAVLAFGSTLLPLSMAHAGVVDYVATSLGGNGPCSCSTKADSRWAQGKRQKAKSKKQDLTQYCSL